MNGEPRCPKCGGTFESCTCTGIQVFRVLHHEGPFDLG